MSTIILKVDLDCHRCYKKISKTICKLQEKMDIQTITFDEKNNTVTISGPFDPQKLAKKLCCKAGKVIKDLQIKEKPKETKPAEPAEPKKDKPKETKPAEPAEPKKDKPKADAKPAEPKEDKPKDDKPAEPKKDKPKDDKPAEPKKDKPKETKQEEPKKDKPKDPEPKKDKPDQPVQLVPQPVWAGPVCGCGCRPFYDGYYGGDRCCWCGRGYGYMPEVPPPAVVYGAPAYGGGYKNCTFFCEEDPQSSCSIM